MTMYTLVRFFYVMLIYLILSLSRILYEFHQNLVQYNTGRRLVPRTGSSYVFHFLGPETV